MSYTHNAVYQHLKALVGFDTQNPPRKINAESEIFIYLKQSLSGFAFKIIDAGNGCLSLLAVRGKPSLLFNFHIDTVPIAEGWISDPHSLIQEGHHLVGLGSCDIKGAAACMLSAVTQSRGDVALLFSSDEEHGSSEAVRKFLTTEHGYQQVVVAEPTNANAIVAHRGIQTATAFFKGLSGHASEKRALKDNAIHKAGRWVAEATSWIEQQEDKVENLVGLPFNIGVINGGVKANMIAASCELKFGLRPLPGQDSNKLLSTLENLLSEADSKSVKIKPGFFGPCLPAANQNFESSMEKGKQLAKQLDIKIGEAVNFWTEASLFSQAGLTAIVFGPGDIAQAHTANEWVNISQLEQVEKTYINILNRNV